MPPFAAGAPTLRGHPALGGPRAVSRRPAVPGASARLAWLLAVAWLAACGRGPARTEVYRQDLSGTWEFRRAAPPERADAATASGSDSAAPARPDSIDLQAAALTEWMPATVPGSVHTDLLADHRIPDPYWRDEEARLQWIEDEDWEYRATFRVDSEILARDRVELVFDGLDTYAEVSLNGAPVLRADNMFRRWEVEVKGRLRPDSNELRVRFRSPVRAALPALRALPYRLPAGNDRGDPPTRLFTRKAAYQYGWDWGPRFVTSGIWRPVGLRAWSGARIRDVQLVQHALTDSLATLSAVVEILADSAAVAGAAAAASRPGPGPADGGRPARLRVSSPDGSFRSASVPARLVPGLNRVRVDFRIERPRRWWPNGLGEAHLYPVRVDLEEDGEARDRAVTSFGLRTLEVVTRSDSIGESFFVRVNGVPAFMKGANWIPPDHFPSRVGKRRYRERLLAAAQAHMNMLRVWGGGIYEDDRFYELADSLGILIWQDFAFANAMYPADSAFLANVRAEAADNVRRLRNHPSLALWCGNNEIDEGWKNWGWPRELGWSPEQAARIRAGYERLFRELLPSVVAELDPGRFYWPSSPSIGWGHPESLARGDAHYWGVWWGGEPFEAFREKLPRFMSEFGFQAYPTLRTIRGFTAPGDRSLAAPVMRAHQKHPSGNEIIRRYMARWYPKPRDFEAFVYLSQLLQAEGMKVALEAHRRARPRTMGSLYWQLDDSWPGVSWSSVDHEGRWKALHYYARRAFVPVLVSPVTAGDTIEVWVASDRLAPVEVELTLEVLGFEGDTVSAFRTAVRIPANRSVRVWARPRAELLAGADPRRTVLVARLEEDGAVARDPSGALAEGRDHAGSKADGGARTGPPAETKLLSENLLYFALPARRRWPDPEIFVRVARERSRDTHDRTSYRVELESPVLARGVHLRVAEADATGADAIGSGDTGPDPRLSDDYFDLLPGRRKVAWLWLAPDPGGPAKPEAVRRRLRVISLAEAIGAHLAGASARAGR
ncbi:MAG: glycoside hydrolase family 2 protein [Gemmatimonadota bacterium]